jgi:putative membrane protein
MYMNQSSPPLTSSAVWQTFRQQAGGLAQFEFGAYLRHRKLLWAACVVVLIPSIYLLIYLSSVWDPSARSTALPVGLVNLDTGFTYQEKTLNIGNDLITSLHAKKQLGYQNFSTEAQARQQVRQGKLACALIIPPDFSANAVPGLQAGQGRLVVYTSAGNNYESSVLASQFAKALGEEVNQTLNEQRWSLVLTASAGSQQSVERLRAGMAQLRTGALELANGSSKAESNSNQLRQGSARLQDGVQRLVDGTVQLGRGIRAMEAGLPPIDDVRSLRLGAEALAAGHQELDKGLQEIRLGSQRMAQSVGAFKSETENSLFVPASVSDGLDRVRLGAEQLDSGLVQAQEGQQKLSQGADTLSAKVRTLTFGVRDLRANLRTMTGKLPEDTQLDQLRQGATDLTRGNTQLHDGLLRLREGSHYLSAGIDLMAQELPSSVGSIEGSAEGLAIRSRQFWKSMPKWPTMAVGLRPMSFQWRCGSARALPHFWCTCVYCLAWPKGSRRGPCLQARSRCPPRCRCCKPLACCSRFKWCWASRLNTPCCWPACWPSHR